MTNTKSTTKTKSLPAGWPAGLAKQIKFCESKTTIPEQTTAQCAARLESGKQKHHGFSIFNHKLR